MTSPLESHPFAHLLTVEESQRVDMARLPSRDKFSVRVALYGLRLLQQVAQEAGVPLEQLQPAQIQDWLSRDATAKALVEAQNMEIDPQFQAFWAQLLWSALKPLQRTALDLEVAIEDLTAIQVIQQFEKWADENQ